MRAKRLGLRIRPGDDVPLINPQDDPRFRTYWQTYHGLMERKGVSPEAAREIVRTRNTVIAALAAIHAHENNLLKFAADWIFES